MRNLLLLFIGLFAFTALQAQDTYVIYGDTVELKSFGGTTDFRVVNDTKDSTGAVAVNTGNGFLEYQYLDLIDLGGGCFTMDGSKDTICLSGGVTPCITDTTLTLVNSFGLSIYFRLIGCLYVETVDANRVHITGVIDTTINNFANQFTGGAQPIDTIAAKGSADLIFFTNLDTMSAYGANFPISGYTTLTYGPNEVSSFKISGQNISLATQTDGAAILLQDSVIDIYSDNGIININVPTFNINSLNEDNSNGYLLGVSSNNGGQVETYDINLLQGDTSFFNKYSGNLQNKPANQIYLVTQSQDLTLNSAASGYFQANENLTFTSNTAQMSFYSGAYVDFLANDYFKVSVDSNIVLNTGARYNTNYTDLMNPFTYERANFELQIGDNSGGNYPAVLADSLVFILRDLSFCPAPYTQTFGAQSNDTLNLGVYHAPLDPGFMGDTLYIPNWSEAGLPIEFTIGNYSNTGDTLILKLLGSSNFTELNDNVLALYNEFETVTLYSNGLNGWFIKNWVNKYIPIYADDAAADADSNLRPGHQYRVTGDRAVYVKP